MWFLTAPIQCVNDVLVYKIFGIPFILIWLISASVFLTVKMNFINFRLFKDAIKTILCIEKETAESSNVVQVSPFTAFATQAAGNLGLGNIAGAAIAVKAGGPGVLFWIFISSFFFSIIKFCEITLGHKYRHVNENGVVSGGTFYFIKKGLINKTFFGYSLSGFAKVLAIMCAVTTATVILSWSFFQLNQIVAIVTNGKSAISEGSINLEVVGCSLIIVFLTGLILVGGIKRIGSIADMVVPLMAGSYLIICGIVIFYYKANILETFSLIFKEAFTFGGAFGGVTTIMIVAANRMMFATEAGAGTAAMVHANSSLNRSSRQGLIAIIDCILIALIICFGGFAILVSQESYTQCGYVGIMLIDTIFKQVYPAFHYLLIIIAFLFGFTTITSNGYAVQKALGYLFGTKSEKISIYLFLVVTFVMSFHETTQLIQFFDVLTLLMLIFNTVGIYFLVNEVKEDLKLYFKEKNN